MHATVCDYIADCTQNAIEAGATDITLTLHTDPDMIAVTIEDNSKGMSPETLRKALDPFYSEPGKHDHRRIGMGLPLIQQAADALDGELKVESVPGKGTKVFFRFNAKHLDTPPMGDIPGTVIGLMTLPGNYDLTFVRDAYSVRRSELVEALGNLEEASNLVLAKEFLTSQETSEEL